MNNDDRRKALAEANASLQAADAAAIAARRRVQELEDAAKREGGISKREFAKAAWIAPLIMSVNLPSSVFAAPALSPPGVTPTTVPVAGPTAAPVVVPTAAPVVVPTAAPVVVPTAAPTTAPTMSPTRRPRAGVPTQSPASS